VGRADWTVLVGAQRLLVPAMRLGAHGGVCGGANIYPRAFVDLYDAARGGDVGRVEQLSAVVERLDGIYRIGAPGVASVIRGVKTALACRGICSGRTAAPFAEYGPEQRAEVERQLAEIDRFLSSA
jgi:4-hydroxy-tetrahydrodipicolinate synthase